MQDNWTKMAPPIAVAVVLLGLTTFVQGQWSERWVKIDSAVVKRWSGHMARIPLTIGDWEGSDAQKASEAEKRIAKFEEERPLNYHEKHSGANVHVALVCGLGRNVSVHTPEKCYLAAGYTLGEQPGRHTITLADGTKAEFYTAIFIKERPEGIERLRIFWAWNDGSGWDAPAWPKVAYARAPALYKMYLICPMPRHDTKITDLPVEEFAKQFLPLLDRALADDAPAPEQTAAR